MKLVHRTIVKRTHKHYKELDTICWLSKNLYNASNYRLRQEFINNNNKYINVYALIKEFKTQFDFQQLPAKVSQSIMLLLDKNWKSFFEANKAYAKDPSKFTGRPKLPKYKDKLNGRNVVIYTQQAISKKKLNQDKLLHLSKTDVFIPCSIDYEAINQVRVVPKTGYIAIEVIYEQDEINLGLNTENIAAIDLGLNNLATITSNIKGFIPKIINGKPLKSINQFFNKTKAKKQEKCKTSKAIKRLCNKREFKINDYLHNASRALINHLIENNIGTLVIGKNDQWKNEINIGKRNNQNFVSIPHNKLIQMLSYKAELTGIKVVVTEESYTSKASFLDNDNIPSYKKGQKHKFSGKRIKRGIYKTSKGLLINADVNGSYNIMRKAISNAFANGIEGVVVHPIGLPIKK